VLSPQRIAHILVRPEVHPHPHPSRKNASYWYSCQSVNVYHWWFLNVEEGVWYHFTLPWGTRNTLLTDSFCHRRHNNNSITVKCISISVFFIPTGVQRRLLTGVEQAIKIWEGEKYRAREFLQLHPTIPVCPRPLSGGTCPFCHPVEAMHAVTIMSLKAVGLQSVDTVLTSRQIR